MIRVLILLFSCTLNFGVVVFVVAVDVYMSLSLFVSGICVRMVSIYFSVRRFFIVLLFLSCKHTLSQIYSQLNSIVVNFVYENFRINNSN